MKTKYVKILNLYNSNTCTVRKHVTNTQTQRFCYVEALYSVNARTTILIQASIPLKLIVASFHVY